MMSGARQASPPTIRSPMREIDLATAERALGSGTFNLIRRGADGSLAMSVDRWRLAHRTPTELRFAAQPPAPPHVDPLVLILERIERVTWDRLPNQQTRSQVRFHLHGGDLWTFSGHVDDPTRA